MINRFNIWDENVKGSIERRINCLIKVGARVSYHARRWYVHMALAFPLVHHYRSVLAWGPLAVNRWGTVLLMEWYARQPMNFLTFTRYCASIQQPRCVAYENGGVFAVKLGMRSAKNYFGTAVAKVAV